MPRKFRDTSGLAVGAQVKPLSDVPTSHVEQLLKKGAEYHRAGDLTAAAENYRRILDLRPDFPDALHLLGVIANQEGRYGEAVQLFEKAIRGNPHYEVYYSNLGNALRSLGHTELALRCYEQAIRLKPDYVDAHANRGALLLEGKQYESALESFVKVVSLQPDVAKGHSNLGNTQEALERYGEAAESFKAVTRLLPNEAFGYMSCARVLLKLRRFEAVIDCYDKALACDASLVQAHRMRGVALFELKRYREAIASFDGALALDPDAWYMEGMRFHVKQILCDWQDAEGEIARIEKLVAEGKRCAPPLSLLSISDAPALQRKAAEMHVFDTCPPSATAPQTLRHERIRIGYFSSDFRNHAVSYLTAGLFERHDRERFEIFGFSTRPVAEDATRLRIAKSIEHFVDVCSMSDLEVTRLSRALEIDIAVDLNGLSSGNRTSIFAQRAAPVQVNYLGYPGTMGADFMDYLIADETVIPERQREHYAEKIAYLPDTFQCTDPDLMIAATKVTREEQGLPEDGFVYCCFNSSVKITPRLFDVWMRVLARVERSVLWLAAGDAITQRNLCVEAERRGVAPERLVFAPNVALPEHLGRQRLADLFLDTLPFNGGATASAALWAGLPILTCMGESFAGRMAASLLGAVGLPDLITSDLSAYEELAVRIGTRPELARELKERLGRNRLTMPLFDAGSFARHLEAAFAAMHQRRQCGLPPGHFRVRKDPIAAEFEF